MKELKSINEIQDYISDLERKNLALQNTHAYRVGMAIMKFYDEPNTINKFLSIKKFVNSILEGTKKSTLTYKKSSIKLSLAESKSNNIIKVEKIYTYSSNQYYYLPKFKTREVVLSMDDDSLLEDKECINLTPNNFRESITLVNADLIQVNLDYLLKKACWRGFGTYDDIKRTNDFLDLLLNNKKLKKHLIHSNNIILFPLFLDRINVFDSVVVVGKTDEN